MEEEKGEVALEAAIVGALMMDPTQITDVKVVMDGYVFTDLKFQYIYNAIITVWLWGQEEVNAVSVRDELKHRGLLKTVGVETLALALEAVPSSACVMVYVNTLMNKEQ